MKGKRLSAKDTKAKLEASAEHRRKVFKELLNHVRSGMSLDCFSAISHVTIGEYLKTYPNEFVREDLDQAMRDGKDGWERIGRKQAEGSCMGNSRSWYYNMSNRYGWAEKQEVKQENSGSVAVNIVSYASTKTPTA